MRRIAAAWTLVLGGLLLSCAGDSQTASESALGDVKSALGEMRAYLEREVEPERSQQLLAMLERFEASTDAFVEVARVEAQDLAELQARYETSPEELRAATDVGRQRLRDQRHEALENYFAFRAQLDDEDWEALRSAEQDLLAGVRARRRAAEEER